MLEQAAASYNCAANNFATSIFMSASEPFKLILSRIL